MEREAEAHHSCHRNWYRNWSRTRQRTRNWSRIHCDKLNRTIERELSAEGVSEREVAASGTEAEAAEGWRRGALVFCAG